MVTSGLHVVSAIVFDFDGTLIDSAPGILKCFRKIIESNHIDPAVSIDETLIGPPLFETLSRITGKDDPEYINGLAQSFKDCYDSTAARETPSYTGVQSMLGDLRDLGLELHIATNKRLLPSLDIISHLGWRHWFESVYALDMVEPRLVDKPTLLSKQLSEQHLEPESTIYIGDKFDDGNAADINDLDFYYASWGYGNFQKNDFPARWHWLDSPDSIARMFS